MKIHNKNDRMLCNKIFEHVKLFSVEVQSKEDDTVITIYIVL